MARIRRVVNIATGEETAIPYTPEEEKAADAAASEQPIPIRPRDLLAELDSAVLRVSELENKVDRMPAAETAKPSE